jgi:hypothetical protein
MSLWLACTSILAAFEVRSETNGNGDQTIPPVRDSGGTLK